MERLREKIKEKEKRTRDGLINIEVTSGPKR